MNQQKQSPYKIWQYIILAQISLGGLALAFVIISFYLNQKILFSIILESSKYIFQEETNKQLQYNWIQQTHISSSVEQTFQNIERVQKIQEFISKSQNFETIQPNPCLQDYRYIDEYCFKSSNCYGIFNKSGTQIEELDLTLNLTSILTQYRYEFGFDYGNIYFTVDNDANFFTVTEGFPFSKQYNPHKRGWYLKYQNSSQKNRIFGDLFLLDNQNIRVPLISELKLNNQHFGVCASELNIKNEIQDSEKLKQWIYIIDSSGLVIYGKQYIIFGTTSFHIYDENITGFNENDWKLTQLYLYRQPFNHSCQETKFIHENTLCLHNSIEQQDLIISLRPIKESPYYIFTFKSNDKVFEQSLELYEIIMTTFEEWQNLMIWIIALIYIIIIILSFISTNVIMKQTNLIISYTNNKIYGKSFKSAYSIYQELDAQLIRSQTMNRLYNSLRKFRSLSYQRQTQPEDQKIIEAIEYPTQPYGIYQYLYPIIFQIRHHSFKQFNLIRDNTQDFMKRHPRKYQNQIQRLFTLIHKNKI